MNEFGFIKYYKNNLITYGSIVGFSIAIII